jgi:hypothetical protein
LSCGPALVGRIYRPSCNADRRARLKACGNRRRLCGASLVMGCAKGTSDDAGPRDARIGYDDCGCLVGCWRRGDWERPDNERLKSRCRERSLSRATSVSASQRNRTRPMGVRSKGARTEAPISRAGPRSRDGSTPPDGRLWPWSSQRWARRLYPVVAHLDGAIYVAFPREFEGHERPRASTRSGTHGPIRRFCSVFLHA